MEVRKTADALLRLQTLPLTGFLRPSSTSRGGIRAHSRYRVSVERSFQRNIATTTAKCSSRFVPSTSAASSQEPSQEESLSKSSESSNETNKATTPPSSPFSSIDEISRSLGWNAPPRPPPSTTNPLSTLFRPPPSSSNGSSFDRPISATDILSSIKSKSGSTPPSNNNDDNNSSIIDVSRMNMSTPSTTSPSSSANRPRLMSDILNDIQNTPRIAPRAPMRLVPSTGRTVLTGPGFADVPHGFQLVNTSCSRNGVKRDSMDQRYHERPGLKRKRLRRVRYRKRFLEGFKATCSRVRNMSRMGW